MPAFAVRRFNAASRVAIPSACSTSGSEPSNADH